MNKFLKNVKQLCVLGVVAITLSCSNDDGGDVAPPSLEAFETTLDENQATGTVIGTISGSTNFDGLTFSLDDETPTGALAIDAQTGELTVADASLWDYEANTTIEATAVATVGEESATSEIKITLNDVDELNVGANGLIAHYTFNNTLADAQGNLPDMEFAGDGNPPRAIPGQDNIPQGAYILENGSQYLKLANQELLVDTDKTFTIAIWINPQGQRQKQQPIIYKEFDHEILASPGEFLSGTLFFSTINYGTPSDTDEWGVRVRLGQLSGGPRRVRWSHLALVCDANKITFYVNGINVGEENVIAPSFQNSGEDLYIGAILGDDGNPSSKFTGTVDDFRYYNQALTLEQVQELAGFVSLQ